jgi:serine/threonine protein phosphatase PrpC
MTGPALPIALILVLLGLTGLLVLAHGLQARRDDTGRDGRPPESTARTVRLRVGGRRDDRDPAADPADPGARGRAGAGAGPTVPRRTPRSDIDETLAADDRPTRPIPPPGGRPPAHASDPWSPDGPDGWMPADEDGARPRLPDPDDVWNDAAHHADRGRAPQQRPGREPDYSDPDYSDPDYDAGLDLLGDALSDQPAGRAERDEEPLGGPGRRERAEPGHGGPMFAGAAATPAEPSGDETLASRSPRPSGPPPGDPWGDRTAPREPPRRPDQSSAATAAGAAGGSAWPGGPAAAGPPRASDATPASDQGPDWRAEEASDPGRPALRLSAIGRTRAGRKGPNEDAFVLTDGLLAVADGVGGHAAGQVAATLAVSTVAGDRPQHAPDHAEALRRAVTHANRAVRERPTEQPDLKGMACTLDVVVLGRRSATGTTLVIGHVGDSTVWLQPGRGRPRQLTEPHSIAGGPLLNAIGARDDVRIDLSQEIVAAGDRIIMATDGLTKVIGCEQLDGLLSELGQGSADAAADALLAAAVAAGTRDDTTIVVADVVPEPPSR